MPLFLCNPLPIPLLPAFLVVASESRRAHAAGQTEFSANFQRTYLWQPKQRFAEAYSGVDRLTLGKEKCYSVTATAAFRTRQGRRSPHVDETVAPARRNNRRKRSQ
ncbi:MAG: hypothetical protein JWQ01_3868 [Massilia sp.]|nr:hypothetical protein [Massilia sp.]